MNSQQSGNLVLNGFRFSLSSSDPVPSSDILSASTGYLVPFTSDAITLMTSGGTLITDSTNGQSISLSFSAFTAGNVYRIFVSDASASGSMTLSAVQWQSASAPGSSLNVVPAAPGGFLVLGTDSTKRYIADVYCASNGQVNDALQDRGVFNNENRMLRRCAAIDNTSSWTVANGVVQPRDNNTTYGVGRFGLLVGSVDVAAMVLNQDGYGHGGSTGSNYGFGFGVDTASSYTRFRYATVVASNVDTGFGASWVYQPSQGRHFFQAMEGASGGTAWTIKSPVPETVLEAFVQI